MKLDNSKSIRIKIMDFLARREHSSKEIYQKLENKVELLDILKQEIKKLEEEGLINNERFAEQYIYSRSSKGFGPVRIRVELIKKGVDENIFQDSIQSMDWSSLAKLVLDKKIGRNIPEKEKEILKIKRFLGYRGFDYSHIEKALQLKRNQKKE